MSKHDEVKLPVTVKPLDWGDRKTNTAGDWTWGAKTSIGWYIASTASGERCKGSHFWFIVGETISAWANSEAEAKAAAQADYTQRILSALSGIPAPGSGETVPDGWKLVPVELPDEMMIATLRAGYAASRATSKEADALIARWMRDPERQAFSRAQYAAMLSASPANPAETQAVEVGKLTRDERQKRVAEWCAAAFGANHQSSVPQRSLRMLEEAIEAYQAATGNAEQAHKLIDYIFAKRAGRTPAGNGRARHYRAGPRCGRWPERRRGRTA